jgi:transcriptional regulator with XRE-family HTH domain
VVIRDKSHRALQNGHLDAVTAGGLLREARLRHRLSREDLAIRAGISPNEVSEIEDDRFSPSVEALSELLALVGENLILGVTVEETGIDLTLNQANLELSTEQRLQRGLAFADVIRRNRRGGTEGLGRPLRLQPLLRALNRHEVNFVVIGSIAGLAHGSAYPTYDLDVAYEGQLENTGRLAAALGEIGLQIDSQLLGDQNALSFNTEFGTLDILRQVPGIKTYEQLRRDSSCALLAGVSTQVASLNHLIAMKRAANRVKDQLMVLEYVELADEIRRREAEETEG